MNRERINDENSVGDDVSRSRREFLKSVGKYSVGVIGSMALAGTIVSTQEAEAADRARRNRSSKTKTKTRSKRRAPAAARKQAPAAARKQGRAPLSSNQRFRGKMRKPVKSENCW
ncbi:hypothetical protein ACFL2Q_14235 [Thermodesulfobacteriota bacterium]